MSQKKIIFGIGCGGCGSHSLYSLLYQQKIMSFKNTNRNKHTYVKHEGKLQNYSLHLHKKPTDKEIELYVKNYLTMIYENNEFNLFKTYLEDNLKPDDISNFHINVSLNLLYYIDEFLKQNLNIKVICLKRDKNKTIKSITQKVLENTQFSFLYGKFISTPRILKTTLEEYYNNYYKIVNELLEKYPKNIKVYDPILFNYKDKQKSMLKWCGFKYTLTKILHENKRDKESFKDNL